MMSNFRKIYIRSSLFRFSHKFRDNQRMKLVTNLVMNIKIDAFFIVVEHRSSKVGNFTDESTRMAGSSGAV